MAGAMAGSATLHHRKLSQRLQVVTLTTNNRCNLRCPHCYLQYSGPDNDMSEATLEAVLASSACHIALVGKEPLVDRRSVLITERLISRCIADGKTVSLITNGIGLHRLSSSAVKKLSWIDLSLDGGPSTYASYRRGNFARVIENARGSITQGARSINMLHTISSANLNNIEDMMSVSDLADWNKIIFSPYSEVRNDGSNTTYVVPFEELLIALKMSNGFMHHPSAFMLMSSDAFLDQGIGPSAVASAVEAIGLSDKVICIENDPLELGYVRVTYDGYVMTPFQSLHPADYNSYALRIEDHANLDTIFEHLRAA